MKQYLSYSEFRSYVDYRDDWYKTYIEGKPKDPSLPMQIGSIVHKTIEEPKYPWSKELTALNVPMKKQLTIETCLKKLNVKRPAESESSRRATTPSGIQLFSIYDGYENAHCQKCENPKCTACEKNTRELDEFKTCDRDDKWTQRRVDYDDQLSFYAYVYYLTCFNYFTEIRLHRINIVKGTVRTFRTTRSRRDITDIAQRIESVVASMQREGLWEKRLSREEIASKNQLTIDGTN